MSYFVEVHSVAITLNGLDNIEGRKIFGVIQANDTVDIYNESKESCKPLLADGTLYLTGPSRPIKGNHFGLHVYLKDKDTDFEISNGYYYMQQYPPSSWYDKPMSIVFEGKHGIATLDATMFQYAQPVSVELRLIDTEAHRWKRKKLSGVEDNSKFLHTIHGTVHARLSGQEIDYQRTLFSRSVDDPQSLNSDMIIPLSRSIIVFPRFSTFDIVADLWEQTDVSGTPAQVVKKTVSFEDTITERSTTKASLTEKLEGVEVKVTWDSEFGSEF